MSFLNKLFTAPKSQQQQNEDYLAKSTSLVDLERRQRNLDGKSRNQTPFGY